MCAVFVQTTTLTNGQIADGGQVNTEVVNLGNSVNNIVDAQITSGTITIPKLKSGSEWADWTPTWSTNGAGTLSATSVSFARYKRIGNTIWFKVDATHTIANTDAATTAVQFTLPVNTTATGHIFHAEVKDPSDDAFLVPGYAEHIHSVAANKVRVYRIFCEASATSTNLRQLWSNGTLREVWVQGFYEIV